MDPTPEPTPFISNRLALLSTPGDISTVKKHALSRKPPPTARRKSKKRLEEVLDLPLDLVFEIASHLNPVDLLNLARTSHRFRATFMSKTALGLWKRVLDRVPGLPECPRDLTHPQYASLMFEGFCMKCLLPRQPRGSLDCDYALRLRLCSNCNNELVPLGLQLLSRFKDAIYEAFSALPASQDTVGHFLFADEFDTGLSPEELRRRDNTGRYYFLPEVELMMAELASRKSSPNSEQDLKKFLSDNEEISSRMRNEGVAMEKWHWLRRCQEKHDAEDMTKRRRKRIIEEMKSLGWEEEFFPTGTHHFMFKEWKAYLNQSKEFSPRGWKMMLKKFTMIYHENRKQKLIARCLANVSEMYPAFRDAHPFQEKCGMPPFLEFVSSTALESFTAAHYETGFSNDELRVLFLELQDGSRGFLERIKPDLLKTMKGFHANNKPTAETLGHAKALFMCRCNSCHANHAADKCLFGFADVVGHWVDGHINAAWKRVEQDIHSSAPIVEAAEDVLTTLGLAEDSTKAQVDQLGKLVCRCGHRDYRGPLDFERLVFHICEERARYTRLKEDTVYSSQGLFSELAIDSHSLGNLSRLVGRVTAGDEVMEDDVDDPEEDVRSNLYCQLCFRIARLTYNFRSGWQGRWHMKSLHGKDLEDGDLKASIYELLAYGLEA